MTCKELNELLRNTVGDIIQEHDTVRGIKNKIIKALIGNQGLASMAKWLGFAQKKDPNEKIYDFGVKPLARIGESCGYTLQLVFVKEDDHENIERIKDLNYKFAQRLHELLTEFVQHPENIQPAPTPYGRAVESATADILNDLLME